MKNVRFAYESNATQMIIDGLNLDIKKKQICSFVGRSGCGKSTTLNLLLRLYDVKQGNGEILIDGHKLTDINLHSYHHLIGVVTQDTQLFARSIKENIAYGLPEGSYTMDDIVVASKKAFCHDFIMGFEDGYDTLVGERGVRMSGGTYLYIPFLFFNI